MRRDFSQTASDWVLEAIDWLIMAMFWVAAIVTCPLWGPFYLYDRFVLKPKREEKTRLLETEATESYRLWNFNERPALEERVRNFLAGYGLQQGDYYLRWDSRDYATIRTSDKGLRLLLIAVKPTVAWTKDWSGLYDQATILTFSASNLLVVEADIYLSDPFLKLPVRVEEVEGGSGRTLRLHWS